VERRVGVTAEHHGRARWKPSRTGIRNIWEYDEQVFAFADGRMILRGPNGSGKSNALALTFPFLFDGTMSAAAMDPFAGGRSMKSLLLGVLRDDARSGFRHDQRLGYVWLEFARSCPDGEEHLTVGCGARVRADGDARSWFFLTDRRVGIDLDLAPDNTPLTRGRLIEELGAEAVHDGAEEHRQVVARDLLGIDADQLGKLNGLIRALRRPQLAGKLNLDELSGVLSSGLPAVATSTLDDIAASLDDLERVQHELAAVRDALATVDAFLPTYRSYLGGEARLRAGAVLDHDRRLTGEQRDLARHEERRRELTDHDGALRAQRSEAESRKAEAEAERDALKDSERFKGAQELEREEVHAGELASSALAAGRHRDEAAQEAERLDRRASGTEQGAQTARADADRSLRDAMDRADRVRATWSLDADAHLDPAQLRSAIDVMVRERREAVAEVRKVIRGFETAVQAHRSAEDARSKADEAVDGAARQVREAVEERDRLRADLAAQVAGWLAEVPGLGDEQRAGLTELVDRVADGEPVALGERYRLATERYRDDLRDERGTLGRAIAEHEEQRNEVQREHDLVAAEEDPGPVAPPWRTGERTGRPGAPLWACCDFATGTDLTPADQAAIEAALEAAGLLDAWLEPDGGVGDGIDAWLRPELTGAIGTEAPTLASVLSVVVPEGSGLAAETVGAVLASIHLDQVGIAVGVDGSFSLGPLTGRAAKHAAEFVGATARAERRARRLAELDASLSRIDAELHRLGGERGRVERALAAWDDAAGGAPDTSALADAAGRVRSDEHRERDVRERARQAADAEATAAAAVSRAGAERDAVATRLAVPSADDVLDVFAKHVEELGDTGREAAQQRTRAVEQLALAIEQRDDARAARSTATRRAEEAQEADRGAKAQRLRVDTLRRTLGDDVGSVFDEVAVLEGRITELGTSVRSLGSDIEANQGAVGEAAGAITAARGRIGEAEGQLRRSERRLPVLRGREVLTLLDLPPDDLPLEPVAFARWSADRLGPPPDGQEHDQVKRAVDRAQKQLLDDLHQGYAPAIVHDDDLILVEVTSDDRSVFGLAELRDRLERQVAEMEQHLTDSDREIFERHLLNRVSHELRRLLGEADEFVRGVNDALARTKTASGLQVELRWVSAGDDPETRRALELLRRDTDHMGDDDRAALRRFFDLAIKRQRAEDPDAGYRGNLEQVVDYRQWHRFQPFLVGPDGRARLTRERFRGLSGGEQAVALHLPLFAAAAAHYDRADDTAPRLVALDEAFAGIDEAMRGELLGLTVAFDLDVLLTGHELWGAYAEVPAIAVHDLLRRPPLEGVSVLTLRWDGHDLSEDASAGRESRAGDSGVPTTGLFAGESEAS
jgi:uncharacterized protein (TIGR02680 family)